MTNNIKEESLKKNIEEYVNEKGWSGFFGLLATISPQRMDQADLKKYNKVLEKAREAESTQVEQVTQLSTINVEGQETSIYAAEHIAAVQDDLREQGLIINDDKKNNEQSKTKVLEPPRSTAPNPWGDAEVVSPGQLNLQ